MKINPQCLVCDAPVYFYTEFVERDDGHVKSFLSLAVCHGKSERIHYTFRAFGKRLEEVKIETCFARS